LRDKTTREAGEAAAGEALAIRREQIRLLYAQIPGAYLATLGTSFIAALFLRPVVRGPLLIGWVAYAVVLTAARFAMLRSYRRAAPQGAALDRWGRYVTAGSAGAAVLWGAAAFVLFVPGQTYYAAFVVILITGMIAGASISLAAFLPTYHAFVLPVGLALLVRLLVLAAGSGGYASAMLALAGLAALFIAMVYFFARRAEANLVTLLRAEQVNRGLSLALSAKLDELARANETLALETGRARRPSACCARAGSNCGSSSLRSRRPRAASSSPIRRGPTIRSRTSMPRSSASPATPPTRRSGAACASCSAATRTRAARESSRTRCATSSRRRSSRAASAGTGRRSGTN
jgi:hypothetical protein